MLKLPLNKDTYMLAAKEKKERSAIVDLKTMSATIVEGKAILLENVLHVPGLGGTKIGVEGVHVHVHVHVAVIEIVAAVLVPVPDQKIEMNLAEKLNDPVPVLDQEV